ncbi:hypothetical protein B0E49_03845 [Polaromonas sp. C04]|nr:hypothetical protein B0E49_03845 [Polaromonas sp. C04]
MAVNGYRIALQLHEAVAQQLGRDVVQQRREPYSLPAALAARAASRTPSSPIDARVRLRVRGAAGTSVLLLASRLPSGPSACAGLEAAPLFGSFIGTKQTSDFSPVWTSGVRPRAFPDSPAANFTAGADAISQFLFGELLRMLRVFDRVGLVEGSRVVSSPMWPSASLNSVGGGGVYWS